MWTVKVLHLHKFNLGNHLFLRLRKSLLKADVLKNKIYCSYLICPSKKRFISTNISKPFKGLLVKEKNIKTNSQTSVALKVSKTIHCDFSSFQKAMHLGSSNHLCDDKNKLSKAFLKEVLSVHFNAPDLKVYNWKVFKNHEKSTKIITYFYRLQNSM